MNEEWEDLEGPGSMVPYRTVVCSLTIPDEPGRLSPFIIAALAIAFAAFCVWLTVRIVNRRERWAKWTAVGMLFMLLLYPFSYGPAYWLYLKAGAPEWEWSVIDSTFEPLRWARPNAPVRLRDAMYDYDAWWVDLELRR